MVKKDIDSQQSDKVTDSTIRKTLDALLPEVLKRAMFMGAGMLFTTEEGVRKALGDFNYPKEAVNYIIKQSEKSKNEFFTIFQRELNRFLSRIDVTRLSKEVMDGISVEVHAKITLRTKDDQAVLPIKVEKLKAPGSKKKTRAKKK